MYCLKLVYTWTESDKIGLSANNYTQILENILKYICLFFSKLASERNPPNPAI